MEFLKYLTAGLLSGTLVLTAFAFLFKESFTRLLDQQMEIFKQKLQIDATTRELTLKSQIDFRERQLGEFYGPIYAYLRRGKPIYLLWDEGRLDEIESDINKLFVAANEAIVAIILTKSHLIAGDKIPESFTRFLTHVAVWHGYMGTEHGGVPLSDKEFPEAYYPEEFEDEIFATTERLKKELFELHNRYGLLISQAV
nr:hypothetical protein [uncultured Albidiferax sp.]